MKKLSTLFFIIFNFSSALAAPLDISISHPKIRLPSLWVQDFGDQAWMPIQGQKFIYRMMETFKFASLIRNVPVPNDTVDFKTLMDFGIDFALYAKIYPSQGTYVAELRVFDVLHQKQILGKRYSSFQKSEYPKVLRRFMNLFLDKALGLPPILGTKIAFAGSAQRNKPRQIYSVYPDGSELQQVTHIPYFHMSPSWSPDGDKLAFTSFKDDKPEIYVYNFITQNRTQLTFNNTNNSGSNWHPEGNKIVYSGGSDGKTSLYSIDSFLGTETKLLIKGNIEVEPNYSPDGKYLAYVTNRKGPATVVIRNLMTQEESFPLISPGFSSVSPSWRSDNQTIAFSGYEKKIDTYDVYTYNINSKELRKLTSRQGDNEKPSWSPDGQYLVFQSNRDLIPDKRIAPQKRRFQNKSLRKLYLMMFDGSHQIPIDTQLVDTSMPSWSPFLKDL